jgi:hypothetical protein
MAKAARGQSGECPPVLKYFSFFENFAAGSPRHLLEKHRQERKRYIMLALHKAQGRRQARAAGERHAAALQCGARVSEPGVSLHSEAKHC